MNREEHLSQRPRKTVLPPLSNRTLYHPSFLPLYKAAGLPHRNQGDSQTAHPIIPAEFFYTDPTMGCGRRIPNRLSGLKVFDCFQLNIPPPIMSACLAPPNRPDPFRSGPHPTRDLGSPTWRIHTIHPPVRPRHVVLQLTQEEDQAVTNLLKLHHQMDDDSLSVDDSNPSPFLSHLNSKDAEEGYKPACVVLREGRDWSDRELEAADTLMSRFIRKEADLLKGQNQNTRTKTPPLLCKSPETHWESEPILGTSDQNCISLSCKGENGNIWSAEDRRAALEDDLPLKMSPEIKSKASVFGGFSEVKERTLSDLEGDAVHVLLSLVDVDIIQ